jgi:hypothetical protein
MNKPKELTLKDIEMDIELKLNEQEEPMTITLNYEKHKDSKQRTPLQIAFEFKIVDEIVDYKVFNPVVFLPHLYGVDPFEGHGSEIFGLEKIKEIGTKDLDIEMSVFAIINKEQSKNYGESRTTLVDKEDENINYLPILSEECEKSRIIIKNLNIETDFMQFLRLVQNSIAWRFYNSDKEFPISFRHQKKKI